MSNARTKTTTTDSARTNAFETHWLVASIIFFVLLLSLNISYGFQYRIDEKLIPQYFMAGSLVFVACMLILVFFTLTKPSKLLTVEIHLTSAIAVLMTLCSLGCSLYFLSGFIALPAKQLLIGTIVVTAILSSLRRFRLAIWFLTACGTALFIYLALAVPIDVKAANMLPIIQASCQSMAIGENPFLRTYPDVASAPMYYLALNVLPYCPFEWSGIDLRWLNVLFFLILLYSIFHKFDFSNKPEIMALTFLPFLFSPMVMQMGYNGHIWSYWLCALLLALTFANNRLRSAAILLGLMLLTRQMAIFVAGMLGVAIIALLGWKKSLRYGLIVLGIFGIGMLATQIYSGVAPQDFYLIVKATDEVTHAHSANPTNQISISGTLVGFGLRDSMLYIQALAAAFICLLFFKSGSLKRWQITILLGLGYMLITSLSVFLHRYFYGSGILIVASGLAFALKDNLYSPEK